MTNKYIFTFLDNLLFIDNNQICEFIAFACTVSALYNIFFYRKRNKFIEILYYFTINPITKLYFAYISFKSYYNYMFSYIFLNFF